MAEKKRKRSVGSLADELIAKSRESALCAIRVFNDPYTTFKTETFIVLMTIAWTYLMHAYYRKKKIEYRHFTQLAERKRFDRTRRGAYKYWELEHCLNDEKCPLEPDVRANLRFLIGLRHEIEHQMTRSLDIQLSGRYQACAINYNDAIKRLFGRHLALDHYLAFSIQFAELSEAQIGAPSNDPTIPPRVRSYIAEFDNALTPTEIESHKFAYRVLFTKQLANRKGQADKVVQFVDPNSEAAINVEKEYWVKKEVERRKFRPKGVVAAVRAAGFTKFKVRPEHVRMWQAEDAKNPSKGYGVDVEGSWYWYQSWIDRCLALCAAETEKYGRAVA